MINHRFNKSISCIDNSYLKQILSCHSNVAHLLLIHSLSAEVYGLCLESKSIISEPFLTPPWICVAIELFGKNWKKVTQHVGTRISAQVRSHAQKVLKDYSPHSADKNDSHEDKSAISEHCETMNLPKDLTMRTDEPYMMINRLDVGLRKASGEGLEEYLTANLNQGHKRYRNTAENTIDVH